MSEKGHITGIMSLKERLAKGFELLKKDVKHMKWAIIAIIAYFVIIMQFSPYLCPVYTFTGIPCPGCGLTRAGKLLLHGDLDGAFHMHPFIYGVAFILIALFISRYVIQKKNAELFKWLCILLIVGMLGFYIYRMLVFFPDVTPMVYYKDAFLYKILRK
ncbi:MAG: DUF2752 domain-containing protein [Lachnospiraceae bacterium]|nr:DUF2752 domain-containing protein [Lachnospiraceae bacterium]